MNFSKLYIYIFLSLLLKSVLCFGYNTDITCKKKEGVIDHLVESVQYIEAGKHEIYIIPLKNYIKYISYINETQFADSINNIIDSVYYIVDRTYDEKKQVQCFHEIGIFLDTFAINEYIFDSLSINHKTLLDASAQRIQSSIESYLKTKRGLHYISQLEERGYSFRKPKPKGKKFFYHLKEKNYKYLIKKMTTSYLHVTISVLMPFSILLIFLTRKIIKIFQTKNR